MEGFVTRWTPTDEFSDGQIETPAGDWYRVKGDIEIETDSIGRRFLVPFEPVEFSFVWSTTNRGKNIRIAKNIRRPWKEKDIDPNGHVELCKVRDEHFLIRQLGGLLTVELGAKAWLQFGQLVECGIQQEFVNGREKWRAVDVRLVAESEETFDGHWRGIYARPVFPRSGS